MERSSLSFEQVALLQSLGFVNVTGFPCLNAPGRTESFSVTKSEPHWLGKSGKMCGRMTVHTLDGQVWWRAGYFDDSQSGKIDQYRRLIAEICPNGHDAMVFCSHGEEFCSAMVNGVSIALQDLFGQRIMNSNEDFNGYIPASGESEKFDEIRPLIVANAAA